jgi:hypothetical protein
MSYYANVVLSQLSPRVGELMRELDGAGVAQLHGALAGKTQAEWVEWLIEERKAVSCYDSLDSKQRLKRLRAADRTLALQLHNACLFVEVLRCRVSAEYFHLPPNGPSLDEPFNQRDFLLSALAAHALLDPEDTWLWEHHHPALTPPFKPRAGAAGAA